MQDGSHYQWRQLSVEDFPLILPMLRATLADEAYYTLPADASEDAMRGYWFSGLNNQVWLLEEAGEPLGVYYQRSNQAGLGAHIANGGYMVAPAARGRGIGRVLGEDSLRRAKERGFRGIQFNFVVSTNTHAVNLWKSLGFEVIGTVPQGFHYRRKRYDDAYIMFRSLVDAAE